MKIIKHGTTTLQYCPLTEFVCAKCGERFLAYTYGCDLKIDLKRDDWYYVSNCPSCGVDCLAPIGESEYSGDNDEDY